MSTEPDHPTHLPNSIIHEDSTIDGHRGKLSRFDRWMLAFAVVCLMGLLITAAILEPSSRGLGTHQKLGLPACSTRIFFGVRCPGCGMTTSWANLLDGNLLRAVQSNLGGVILCGTAIFSLPILIVMSIRGVASYRGWYSRVLLVLLLSALGIAVAEWIWRLATR